MDQSHTVVITNPGDSNKSYVDAFKQRKPIQPTSVDVASLPNPSLIEGEPALEIPTKFFEEGCQQFQHNFIARMDYTGLKFNEMKQNLEAQWKFTAKFVPMTKGFFIIMLSSKEDKEKVRKTKWFINEHLLRLIDWYPSFNPEKQATSHATVWVRFPRLPVELWTEKTILSMGKVLGNPIVLDQKTLDLDFGYFAADLVDIDFGKHIPERIIIKSGGKSFWQYLDIPKSPKFCLHCNIIGHHEKECKNKPANKTVHNNDPAQDNSTSSQSWQEVQSKRKSRKEKNSGTSQGLHEGNAGSVEKTTQLEEEVSRSEAEFNASAAKLERAKQAAADNLALVNGTELERTSALVTMLGASDELARTNRMRVLDGSQALMNPFIASATSNTDANENAVNRIASQEHIVKQAITEREVVKKGVSPVVTRISKRSKKLVSTSQLANTPQTESKIPCSEGVIAGLGLRGFENKAIHNSTVGSIGNIWILWKDVFDQPEVINTSRQAITIKVDGVFMSFVHASYIQVFRRRLWQQLSLHDLTVPWLIMGDFNCVLHGDEKKGGHEPRPSCINEFSDWMDNNNLFEADSLGCKLPWTNGQSGTRHILSKLDRAIINEAWITKFANWRFEAFESSMKLWNQTVFGNVNTRFKQAQLKFEVACRNSDEHPHDVAKLNVMKNALVVVQDVRMQQHIMLKKKSQLVSEDGLTISDPDQILDHVASYYEAKFNGTDLPIDEHLFEYDHASISVEENQMLDAIPSLEEIKTAVFDLGADSAPGPDGFSGCFYRHCWDLINQDLFKDIIFCWTTKSIPNGVAFMKGRNIYENISLASEMVNELHIKRKDGNLGLKLDISQDFDIVSRSFVLEVFRRYDFSEDWCSWIHNILKSAHISILLNGSRKGIMKSVRNLVKILEVYQCASGQRVCREKNKIYNGGGSLST
ncbi:uncharacterized protein LOC113351073 [Papaver somniferum]|uniref:uncharacterized protein LOC113351073 n=1 Tax=Papaver somniferum TaxID=3469 RepID=UPI000E6F5716|nr:uncharacterized protein LOC113351073 [Papaver somniferum]